MTKYTDGGYVNLDEEEFYFDGERLTEERANQLAEQFEKYGAERAKGGRPSLGSGVSPQVSFRVPAEMKDALDTIATSQGRTPADVAREALSEYLNSHRSA